MSKLIVSDTLGHVVLEVDYAGYDPDEMAAIARREAEAQARDRGRVTWRILDGRRRELASGEAAAPAREGLLPIGSAAVYCEWSACGLGLAAYGTVVAVRSGHYHLEVDHLESEGRPVDCAAGLELRIPVDTRPVGATRTLEALQVATAAE